MGVTIGLRPECLAEYERIHVKLWPEIEKAIKDAGIGNYSIFYLAGQLFGYFEYVGPEGEFEARMKRLAEAPRMRQWWAVTEPMQVPREDRGEGEWWSVMSEVFHLD